MIVAAGLEKHFGATHALRGLDLDVVRDDVGFRRPTLDEVFLAPTASPAGSDEAVAAEGRPQDSAA